MPPSVSTIGQRARPGGLSLRSDYASPGHILSRYLKAADLERPGRREPDKRPLTADECAEVLKYWPLVESEARKIARKDEELYDRLTTIGMDALESSARRWDGARGLTLGAFAELRVRGSMLNYLDRVLNREPKGQDPTDDEGKRWFRGMTRKPRLESFVAEWLAATPEPKSYLIPGKRSLDALEVALAKLNPRQRAVYRGRVLQNPPLSRAALARELGITDLTQISRIEKQARQKMKKCHPPCTKTGI